jgi:hypothetical protein
MKPNEFRTDALAFSGFLHCTARLRFLRVEEVGNGKSEFVFADPQNEASDLRKEFESRKTFVEPRAFHQSLRTLRAELSATKDTEQYELRTR